MKNVDALHSDKSLMKYLYPKGLQEELDTFVLVHMNAHKDLPFHLTKHLQSDPSSIGFLENYNKYYYSLEKSIYFESIEENSIYSNPSKKIDFSDNIRSISRFQLNPDILAVGTDSTTDILNYNLNITTTLPFNDQPHNLAFVYGTSTPSLASISSSGKFQLTDIEKGEIFECSSVFPFSLLSAHPSQPLVLLLNQDVQIVDLRTNMSVRNVENIPGCLCVEWLPNDAFGAGMGFDDGKISLYNFESQKPVFSQKAIDGFIENIGFHSNKDKILMNFSSGDEFLFGTLPIWGYGHFRVEKSYKIHAGNIMNMEWWKDNENSNILRMITNDNHSFIHLFDLDSDSFSVYNPEI